MLLADVGFIAGGEVLVQVVEGEGCGLLVPQSLLLLLLACGGANAAGLLLPQAHSKVSAKVSVAEMVSRWHGHISRQF